MLRAREPGPNDERVHCLHPRRRLQRHLVGGDQSPGDLAAGGGPLDAPSQPAGPRAGSSSDALRSRGRLVDRYAGARADADRTGADGAVHPCRRAVGRRGERRLRGPGGEPVGRHDRRPGPVPRCQGGDADGAGGLGWRRRRSGRGLPGWGHLDRRTTRADPSGSNRNVLLHSGPGFAGEQPDQPVRGFSGTALGGRGGWPRLAGARPFLPTQDAGRQRRRHGARDGGGPGRRPLGCHYRPESPPNSRPR